MQAGLAGKPTSTIQSRPRRRAGMRYAVWGAAIVLAVAAAHSHAATRNWLGLGASASWSEAANWSPGLPGNGDDLIFRGNPARLVSTVDLSLTLSSLRFEADSQLFELHVSGSGGHALSFAGLGIQNLTAGSGPIRQEFFADAGSSGGSITFTSSAGINLGDSDQYRPVNITAQGAAVAGAVGGRIVFEGSSSTGTSTFTALRVEGARTAGAGAGSLLLRDAAVSTPTGIVVAAGGDGGGSLGGQVRFADDSQLQGRLTVLAGTAGGQGGRALFEGRAAARLQASVDNRGADSGATGTEAVTTFAGQARLAASAINWPATAAAANGGRLEFKERSSFDSTGLDPSLGPVQILNRGSDLPGARGGSLVFADDSFTRGSLVVISNGIEVESLTAGSAGGTTEFRDRSHAGGATIYNAGAAVGSFFGLPSTPGGQTSFRHDSSAGSARIESQGGRVHSALGGRLELFDNATAGAAVIFNHGSEFAGAHGGLTHFTDRSTAAEASIYNNGGRVVGALGGQLVFGSGASAGNATIENFAAVADAQGGRTLFNGRAGAGTATIANNQPLSAFGGSGVAGATVFADFASAERSTILNIGAWFSATEAGRTRFADDSSAADATIYNLGARAAGALGGFTLFSERATAGNAHFVVRSGAAAGTVGGMVEFLDHASAGSALFEVDGAASFANVSSGVVHFFDRTSAASSTLQLGGSRVAGLLGAEASFHSNATAGQASISVGGGAVAGALGARVVFTGVSGGQVDAGTAQIINQRGTVAGAAGATTLFSANTTAASARIVNEGADFASLLLHSGATTVFILDASAGGADIRNEGGRAPQGVGGMTLFEGSSGAGDATISNAAGLSAGIFFGGTTFFTDSSSAQRARIVNQAATDDFALSGGATYFSGVGNAGTAHISAEGSASATRGAGLIGFNGGSAAGATLVAEGATGAGGQGGRLSFGGNANAADATLIAGSAVAAGNGGLVTFADTASAGRARAIVEGGAGRSPGELDISRLSSLGTTIGSIEGGGIVSLGSKVLRSGGNHRETTFSGLIRDDANGSGGRLLVEGNGRLTLTGANTYTGSTTIADGTPTGSGKLVVANTTGSATGSGPVIVNRGGTLGGSGFIAGPVTLRAGGTIAPGDPVTLTLHDSLTWHGGGVIRLALGADSAGSDHLVVGDLVRGDDGDFLFELVDFGAAAGQQYELVSFGNLVGFDADDFSFTGIDGNFALAAHGLLFTATASAVPEPAAAWLLLAGVLALGGRCAGRRRGPSGAASKGGA